jgi:hypothetical protein
MMFTPELATIELPHGVRYSVIRCHVKDGDLEAYCEVDTMLLKSVSDPMCWVLTEVANMYHSIQMHKEQGS